MTTLDYLRSGRGALLPPAGLAPVSASTLAGQLQHGTSFVAQNAIQTVSNTVAAVGGGLGAAFGPAGVANAPVPTAGVSTGGILLVALVLAGGVYLVTR